MTTNRNNTGGGRGGANGGGGNRGGKRNAVPAAPAHKRTTTTKLASSARPITGTNASSSSNSRAPPTTTTSKDPGGSSIDKKQKRENDRSKRVAQMNQSIKNKADGENQFFRQCRTAAAQRSTTSTTRPVPTELELFGQQGSQGINFAKYNDIRVEVRRGQQQQQRRSDDGASSTATEVVFPDDFTALPSLPAALRRNVARMNYASLTPIQKHAIPLALAGDDLMCCAQTGSGKTCAFLLPIISRLISSQSGTMMTTTSKKISATGPATPRCLVLAPTRELAIQIELECQKLCHALPDNNDIFAVTVYGGSNARDQLKGLAEGADVVVATPGRLLDFVSRKLVSLAQVQYLVLDEADRMMDMGFMPQIKKLILQSDMMGNKGNGSIRQTMMFSATFDPPIQKIAAAFLRDTYAWIAVGRVGSTTDSITQTVVLAPNDKRQKLNMVVKALTNGPPGRTMIFVRKKASATWLKKMLNNGGPADGQRFNAIATEDIHGDRSQVQRESALTKFRTGELLVLVCTDVASRGLDIPGVEHVINMDLPIDVADFDSYVHRIGRTGRAGHTGLATSLFVPSENEKIGKLLVQQLKETQQEVPGWLEEMFGRGGGAKSGAGRGAIGTDVRRRSSSGQHGSPGGRGQGPGRDITARGPGPARFGRGGSRSGRNG